MRTTLAVLLTPAELATARERDLGEHDGGLVIVVGGKLNQVGLDCLQASAVGRVE